MELTSCLWAGYTILRPIFSQHVNPVSDLVHKIQFQIWFLKCGSYRLQIAEPLPFSLSSTSAAAMNVNFFSNKFSFFAVWQNL